jgi:hypothetical protein
VVAARQHRGPPADAEMRSPSRRTCVARHAVQVHWWTANGSLKNEPRRRGRLPQTRPSEAFISARPGQWLMLSSKTIASYPFFWPAS